MMRNTTPFVRCGIFSLGLNEAMVILKLIAAGRTVF